MKVALITGGSSGIGEAAAKELARRGWQVAIMFSRNRAEADRVAGDINGLALQGDVAQDADCRRVAKAVLDKWGRIDALVNSAGTTKFVAHGDLEGLSAEDILGIFRVNVVGPYQMIRACAQALKEAHGCVVNISSLASLLGTGSSVAYAASKAALDTMTLSLARALGPEVRLNVVAPGYVRTPWQIAAHGADGAADLERRFAERAPLKSAAEAQDVAEAIAWLIEGARRVTGEIIYVDAGMHIAAPR
jgi:NAD(P)-dependent dehydrogenase (short-subunit alcohol dehydrogenase family)